MDGGERFQTKLRSISKGEERREENEGKRKKKWGEVFAMCSLCLYRKLKAERKRKKFGLRLMKIAIIPEKKDWLFFLNCSYKLNTKILRPS